MEQSSGKVTFVVPEAAYLEGEERPTTLIAKRGGDPKKALALSRSLVRLVELIGSEVYGGYETEARERLGSRDPEDWPILASALTLGCPI